MGHKNSCEKKINNYDALLSRKDCKCEIMLFKHNTHAS